MRRLLVTLLFLLSLGCGYVSSQSVEQRQNEQRIIQLLVEQEKVRYEIQLVEERIKLVVDALTAKPGYLGSVALKKHLDNQSRVIELKVQLRGIEKELELLGQSIK